MIFTYKGEKLENHIKGMLMAWNSLSSRYNSMLGYRLKTLLDNKEPPLSADRTMRAIIILHDVGKCIPLYQAFVQRGKDLGGYRHEIVSAYIAQRWLSQGEIPEHYRTLVTLSVLLTHEAILFNRLERTRLHSFTGCIEDMIFRERETEILAEAHEIICGFMKNEVGLECKLPYIIYRTEVNKCIEDFIARVQMFSGDFMHKLRVSYTPFLMLLKLCDYKAASERARCKV
jgi:CRISPR-associated endonuclease Cas3-HD